MWQVGVVSYFVYQSGELVDFHKILLSNDQNLPADTSQSGIKRVNKVVVDPKGMWYAVHKDEP